MTRLMLVGSTFSVLLLAGCAAKSPRPAAPVAAAAVREPQGPVIVRLVGQHQEVIITSGPSGPLYSAKATDGRVLVANATLPELRERHPHVYRFVEPTVAVQTDTDGAFPGASRTPAAAPTAWAGLLDASR